MNLQALTGLQLAVRAGVGAVVALQIAQLVGSQHPVYAFIAAVIATDLVPSESRKLGLRRLIATAIGAVCGAALSLVLPSDPWSIGLSVLIAILGCELFGIKDGSRVAGFICGVIVLHHAGEPWEYAFHRFIETALGVAVAWAISYVPKLIRIQEPAVPESEESTSQR
jgi:uncharacterized membrane protein YgaE (UPF0421/DUF939 family)